MCNVVDSLQVVGWKLVKTDATCDSSVTITTMRAKDVGLLFVDLQVWKKERQRIDITELSTSCSMGDPS